MRNIIYKIILVVFCVVTTSSCTSMASQTDSSSKVGHKETGKAAFYAIKFQGKKTASGERFDQSAYTAAHKSLPFGTKVKVANVKSGKTVTVRVNDRGPYIKGRIIDLSRSAFTRIASVRVGVIYVVIEVVD